MKKTNILKNRKKEDRRYKLESRGREGGKYFSLTKKLTITKNRAFQTDPQNSTPSRQTSGGESGRAGTLARTRHVARAHTHEGGLL